jgi:hypothetical protein
MELHKGIFFIGFMVMFFSTIRTNRTCAYVALLLMIYNTISIYHDATYLLRVNSLGLGIIMWMMLLLITVVAWKRDDKTCFGSMRRSSASGRSAS